MQHLLQINVITLNDHNHRVHYEPGAEPMMAQHKQSELYKRDCFHSVTLLMKQKSLIDLKNTFCIKSKNTNLLLSLT